MTSSEAEERPVGDQGTMVSELPAGEVHEQPQEPVAEGDVKSVGKPGQTVKIGKSLRPRKMLVKVYLEEARFSQLCHAAKNRGMAPATLLEALACLFVDHNLLELPVDRRIRIQFEPKPKLTP